MSKQTRIRLEASAAEQQMAANIKVKVYTAATVVGLLVGLLSFVIWRRRRKQLETGSVDPEGVNLVS